MKNRIFMFVPQIFNIADKLGIYSDNQTIMVEEYFHTEMKMVADMEGASKDCLEAAAVQIKEETFDAIGRLAGFNLVYHLTGKNRLSIDQEGAESALPGAVGMGAGAAAGAAAGMAAGEATDTTTGSNVNVTASDPSNGAYGNVENAERVYNALINAGFSPVAASAFLGNFYAENGIEPGTSIPEKGSCGIAQWLGDRKTRLVEYANERGLYPTDLQTQIDYLIEVDIPINLDSDAVNKLNSMTDPQLAGDYICTYFERPQNFTSHDKWQESTSWKGDWERYGTSEFNGRYYIDMEKRKDGAAYWYQQFNG